MLTLIKHSLIYLAFTFAQLRLHLGIDVIILLLTGYIRMVGHGSGKTLRLTYLFVLVQVSWDLFAILVPAMAWPVATPAHVTPFLLLDAGCLAYVSAVLYADKALNDSREEVESLQKSQYKLATA